MADKKIKLEDMFYDPEWGNSYNFKDRKIGGSTFPYDDYGLKHGDYGKPNYVNGFGQKHSVYGGGPSNQSKPSDRENNLMLLAKFGDTEDFDSTWDELKEFLGAPFSNKLATRSYRGSFYTGAGGPFASFNPNKEFEDPNDGAEEFGDDIEIPLSFSDVMIFPVPKDNSIIGKDDDSVWDELVKMTAKEKKYLENK